MPALLAERRPWEACPPQGAPIDFAHPLRPDYCFLFNEGAGQTVRDSITGSVGTIHGAGTWGRASAGEAYYNTAGADYVALTTKLFTMTPYTWACRFSLIVGAGSYALVSQGSFNPQIRVQGTNIEAILDGGTITQTLNVSFLTGFVWDVVVINAGAGVNQIRLYVNGTLNNQGQQTAAFGAANTNLMGAGGSSGSVAVCSYQMGWNRVLSAGDVQSLHVNPYQFLLPLRESRALPSAAGPFPPWPRAVNPLLRM